MGCPVKNRIAFLFGLAALAATSLLVSGASAAGGAPQYGKWGVDTAENKIKAILSLFKPLGIKELVRTGRVAMIRGSKTSTEPS